jgi:uncharacterized protein (DUF2235 family)
MSDTSSARPKKRLALFLDGTWNQGDDNTNVWRLRSLFAPVSSDGCEQRAYYSTGLGTKFGERIRGGMFGRGIDTAITGAYEWLIDNYDPDDEIFIFGFSRGAYTARSLSGFILKCGLLQRGAPLGVNQLYRRYRQKHLPTIRDLIIEHKDGPPDYITKYSTMYSQSTQDDFREEAWMLKYAQAVPIKFLGVFDTVGALGVPFALLRKLKGSAYPFLNTGLRHDNEYAFHALAIDEHRKAFRPTLWSNQGATTAKPRSVERTEQRWFVGAHANVGGGYFTDPLAQIPLKWIERKAVTLGLTFKDEFVADENAATATISDSFADFAGGWYRPLKLWIPYHRRIGLPPKGEGEGVTNINETIDSSVFSRWRTDPTYRPGSLRRWARTNGGDPTKITKSVRADNPSVAVDD